MTHISSPEKHFWKDLILETKMFENAVMIKNYLTFWTAADMKMNWAIHTVWGHVKYRELKELPTKKIK